MFNTNKGDRSTYVENWGLEVLLQAQLELSIPYRSTIQQEQQPQQWKCKRKYGNGEQSSELLSESFSLFEFFDPNWFPYSSVTHHIASDMSQLLVNSSCNESDKV